MESTIATAEANPAADEAAAVGMHLDNATDAAAPSSLAGPPPSSSAATHVGTAIDVAASSIPTFVSRDESAQREESGGGLVFRVVSNDGSRKHMVWLIQAKNIFATQLPKMPREYISRLVFDRKHRSLLAVKNDRVVGGICYRPFLPQQFAEIAFCAVTSSEQVKGYGTRLMNHLKEAVKLDDIRFFLTYADNYAIGYFKKQGFTKQVSMPPERWVGYIKDYEGAHLMECTIAAAVNYLDVPGLVQRQREAVLARIREKSHAHVVHPGLSFPERGAPVASTAAAVAASGEEEEPGDGGGMLLDGSPRSGASVAAAAGGGAAGVAHRMRDLSLIPGVAAAGWSAAALGTGGGQGGRGNLAAKLADLTEKLIAHDDSWPFREPVETSLVPEYLNVVKEPIDLSVIQQRARDKAYSSLEHFLADVHLLFRNCRAFNKPDTEYVACANKLEAFLRVRLTGTWQQQQGAAAAPAAAS